MYGKAAGRRVIVSALIVLAVLTLISRTVHPRTNITVPERLLADALAPLQGVLQRLASPFTAISREISRLRIMSDENLMMRERVLALPWLETDLLESRLENQRLRELLKFAQSTPYQYVPAVVVGRSPDSWLSTCTINRGTQDGISRDDAVVTSAGLIGRVIKADTRSSVVMLLTDPDSGVGSLVERSRDAGVVVGQAGTKVLRMKLFSRDADIKQGDVIVTSGLGSVYPKGIPIGKVMSIGRGDYGLVKTADITTMANLDRIEEVLVIKSGTAPEGPR